MDLKDFTKAINKRYRFNKLSEYFSAFVLFIFGLATFFIHTSSAIVLSCVFILVSILGFTTFIPKNYQITIINSDLPLDRKDEIIKNILKSLNVEWFNKDNGYYRTNCGWKLSFFNTGRDINIAVDENGFYISIIDPYTRGFIEIGGKTKEYISMLVNSIDKEINLKKDNIIKS